MRPDKRKKNRGRNIEKSDGNSAQERKADENVDNNSESVSSAQKETEKADVSKLVKVEETAEKKTEVPPILNLRRETDELKETKKFSKRQIFSNWDKYDEPIVLEEEDEIHDDFGSLIQRNFSEIMVYSAAVAST
ncbi:hypothetical protein J437_LFUL001881 [Ladona fulva]|uniref:Uncharacterized protein n=1 Tax=Ladona fulva TaxID=123851 RepID=A0A8K0NV16_LADFU|nr:hypothetical protein J437_LFUL001881 [Ladona fulva]